MQGDVVAISPYESHLDPRLYGPNAAAFNPHRRATHTGSGALHAGAFHLATVGHILALPPCPLPTAGRACGWAAAPRCTPR